MPTREALHRQVDAAVDDRPGRVHDQQQTGRGVGHAVAEAALAVEPRVAALGERAAEAGELVGGRVPGMSPRLESGPGRPMRHKVRAAAPREACWPHVSQRRAARGSSEHVLEVRSDRIGPPQDATASTSLSTGTTAPTISSFSSQTAAPATASHWRRYVSGRSMSSTTRTRTQLARPGNPGRAESLALGFPTARPARDRAPSSGVRAAVPSGCLLAAWAGRRRRARLPVSSERKVGGVQ